MAIDETNASRTGIPRAERHRRSRVRQDAHDRDVAGRAGFVPRPGEAQPFGQSLVLGQSRAAATATGSWWVDSQRPSGMLDGVVAAEEAARMIRADRSKTSHGGDK